MAWCAIVIHTSAIPHNDFHESVGVLFTNHDRVIQKQLGSDILTVIIKIPDFHKINKDTSFNTNQVSCPTFESFKNECINAIEALDIELERKAQLVRAYNNEVQDLNILLFNLRIRTNNKRALIDISGALSSIFGTASQSQVDNIQHNLKQVIKSVRNNDNNMNSLFHNVKMLTNKVINDTLKINRFIDSSDKKINEIITTLNSLTDDFDGFYKHFQTIDHNIYIIKSLIQIVNVHTRAVTQNSLLNDALLLVKNFKEGVIELVNHKLSSHIVPPQQMTIALKSLENDLQKDFPFKVHLNLDGNAYYEDTTAHT